MEAQMIEAIDFNWSADGNGGANWETHAVGRGGVKKILDVTEDGVACYRVEFDDNRAELVFNPNRVFYSAVVI
jgi:hypothetical protein